MKFAEIEDELKRGGHGALHPSLPKGHIIAYSKRWSEWVRIEEGESRVENGMTITPMRAVHIGFQDIPEPESDAWELLHKGEFDPDMAH